MVLQIPGEGMFRTLLPPFPTNWSAGATTRLRWTRPEEVLLADSDGYVPGCSAYREQRGARPFHGAVVFLDNRAGLWFPDVGGHDEDGGAGSGGESSQIWSCSSAGSLGKSVKRVVAISQRSKFRGCRCVSPGGGHWNMLDIGEQGCIASTQAIKSANLSSAGFYRVLLSINRAERSLSLHTPT